MRIRINLETDVTLVAVTDSVLSNEWKLLHGERERLIWSGIFTVRSEIGISATKHRRIPSIISVAFIQESYRASSGATPFA